MSTANEDEVVDWIFFGHPPKKTRLMLNYSSNSEPALTRGPSGSGAVFEATFFGIIVEG
jgi:hypothetical protein